MKQVLPVLAGVALIAATVPFFTQPSQAQQPAANPAGKALTYPAGLRCVVRLNPEFPSQKRSTNSNVETYEITDNQMEGEFLTINAEWLVLKDGNYENWIPRDKVLSMRVSR